MEKRLAIILLFLLLSPYTVLAQNLVPATSEDINDFDKQVAEQMNIGAELLLLFDVRLFGTHIFAATRSPITTVPTTSLPVSAISPVRTP